MDDYAEFNGIDDENDDTSNFSDDANADSDLWIDDLILEFQPEDAFNTRDMHEWLKEVDAQVDARWSTLDQDKVRARHVRNIVRRRVGQVLKKGNAFFRDIFEKGRLPLGWGDGDDWKEYLKDVLRLPVATGEHTRVPLGKMTQEDVSMFVQYRRQVNDRRQKAGEEICLGGELALRWMQDQKVNRIDLLVDDLVCEADDDE